MKYKFTGETKTLGNTTLKQIVCVTAFSNVAAGDVGGWIESEKNLSQDGNSWVFGDARVYGYAWVFGDARVYGYARVYGNAEVYGDAEVYGNAEVYGDAEVYGYAEVHGDICRAPAGALQISRLIITT